MWQKIQQNLDRREASLSAIKKKKLRCIQNRHMQVAGKRHWQKRAKDASKKQTSSKTAIHRSIALKGFGSEQL